MRYPDEPHVLIGSTLVHAGAVSMLRDLVATNRVTLDDDGDGVTVDPLDDLHQDVFFARQLRRSDLTILLRSGGQTVH